VVKVKDTVDEILLVDTEHPYLLIVKESTRLVIETVFSETSTEIVLHFSKASVV